MAIDILIPNFIFVIDTNKYSGNFERQLCAFITGCIGECGVGQNEQELFLIETNQEKSIFNDYILYYPDEHGCKRPASIWETPGRTNDGHGNHFNTEDINIENCYNKTKWPAYESVAIFFDKKPPKKLINLMIQRNIIFCKEHDINIISLREIKMSLHKKEKFIS